MALTQKVKIFKTSAESEAKATSQNSSSTAQSKGNGAMESSAITERYFHATEKCDSLLNRLGTEFSSEKKTWHLHINVTEQR